MVGHPPRSDAYLQRLSFRHVSEANKEEPASRLSRRNANASEWNDDAPLLHDIKIPARRKPEIRKLGTLPGAPSLRFVQGRVRCCQIAEVLRPAQAWARGFQEHKNMIPAPSHPPLQTTQGWGTLVFFVVISRKTEMVGHPPIFVFYSPSHVIRAL